MLRWAELLKPFGVEQALVNQTWREISAAYSVESRYYHNLDHINQVLDMTGLLREQASNFAAIQFAAWFHDLVYDTQAKDNEERSADYAQATLQSLGLPAGIINDTCRLILNTRTHQASPDDTDSLIFLDCDLSILGADPARYRAYAQAIRQEYAWVEENQYRAARKQILEKFRQRDRLFFTGLMFNRLEQPARQNLDWEIARL